MRTILPWRLQIFEKFPTRPQMVKLRIICNEFSTPRLRDSFIRQFFDSEYICYNKFNNEKGFLTQI